MAVSSVVVALLIAGVTYAASVINTDDEITQNEWNELVGRLIPTGAIMPFNLSSCPSGWTRYAAADNKFLMGASGGIGTTGGSASVKLTKENLAPHSHYFQDTAFMEKGNANKSSGDRVLKVDTQETRNNWPGSNGGSDSDNSLFFVYRRTSNRLCSTSGFHYGVHSDGYSENSACQGSATAFSTQNPFVKVLYCTKN